MALPFLALAAALTVLPVGAEEVDVRFVAAGVKPVHVMFHDVGDGPLPLLTFGGEGRKWRAQFSLEHFPPGIPETPGQKAQVLVRSGFWSVVVDREGREEATLTSSPCILTTAGETAQIRQGTGDIGDPLDASSVEVELVVRPSPDVPQGG